MTSDKHLLTFELNSNGETLPKDLQLEIHLDHAGLKFLTDYLTNHSDYTENDHFHLMTSAWGGNELSEDIQAEGDTLINHVKVFLWK